MKWITVGEYCKKKGIKNPQVVYNQIAMRKFKGSWREVEIKVKRKQILYVQ